MPAKRQRIVSLSGIDGAGKTTQIEALCKFLARSGVPFELYTFWDDVVSLPSLRERMSRKVFKGDQGVGTPDSPIKRRDKNVRSWYATALRFMLYTLDAFKLRRFVRRIEKRAPIIIFDRYLYDELANLPLGTTFGRIYVRMLLGFTPKPDVALLLDADPESATSRKPEYPLDFVRKNRDAYVTLSRMASMTVIAPGAIEVTTETVCELAYPKGLQLGSELHGTALKIQCFQER